MSLPPNILMLVMAREKNLLDLFFNSFVPTLSRKELTDLSKPQQIFDIVRPETDQAKAFCLEAKIDQVKDPTGKVTNLVAALRDVTEQRREKPTQSGFPWSDLAQIAYPLNRGTGPCFHDKG